MKKIILIVIFLSSLGFSQTINFDRNNRNNIWLGKDSTKVKIGIGLLPTDSAKFTFTLPDSGSIGNKTFDTTTTGWGIFKENGKYYLVLDISKIRDKIELLSGSSGIKLNADSAKSLFITADQAEPFLSAKKIGDNNTVPIIARRFYSTGDDTTKPSMLVGIKHNYYDSLSIGGVPYLDTSGTGYDFELLRGIDYKGKYLRFDLSSGKLTADDSVYNILDTVRYAVHSDSSDYSSYLLDSHGTNPKTTDDLGTSLSVVGNQIRLYGASGSSLSTITVPYAVKADTLNGSVAASTTIITGLRNNAGTLEYKSNTITIDASGKVTFGTESAWTPVYP